MNRRHVLAILATLATGLSSTALAQQTEVLRVVGGLDAGTYKGLEAFLFNSMDEVVGLKIHVEATEGGENGSIAAGVDGDGKFIGYLVGDGESEIVADAGFTQSRGSVIFDGFFVVKSGGMHQGIVSLYLDRADEASVLLSGRPVKDVAIARLDPRIREN